jgi:hypothetical protein
MPSPSVEPIHRRQHFSGKNAMKKIWFALTLFVGGFAHELRNPFNCQCINTRPAVVRRLRRDES